MKRIILIPQEAEEDLEKLISLDKSILSLLADVFSTNPSITFKELINKFHDKIGTIEDLYSYYSILNFLTGQKEDLGISEEELLENIRLFFEEKDSALKDNLYNEAIKKQLLRIFTKTEEQLIEEKITRLSEGLLDKFINMQTYCEIRPIFNLDRSNIIKNIPTITAQVQVLTNKGETKIYTFQMNEEMLNECKNILNITSKKLETVKSVIDKIK